MTNIISQRNTRYLVNKLLAQLPFAWQKSWQRLHYFPKWLSNDATSVFCCTKFSWEVILSSKNSMYSFLKTENTVKGKLRTWYFRNKMNNSRSCAQDGAWRREASGWEGDDTEAPAVLTTMARSSDCWSYSKHCERITRKHPQRKFSYTKCAGHIPAFTSLSVSQTHWAALARGRLCGLAVTHILTHHVLTKHRPRFAYTDSTRLGVPYLIVGVESAVRCAGIFVENNSKWHQCPESLSVSW